MPKTTIHETHRIAYDGAIDADGHILEPPDLWERYIDPRFRDRALRIRRDEHGLEELEIGGQRSLMSRRGFPSTLGAMGAPDLAAMQKDPARTYLAEAPFGSMDPAERLEVLDAEHLDAAILYTTVGLLWEAELTDPELSQAYTTRLQPLDLRVLRRLRPAGAHRPPVAVRSRRRRGRARTGRGRGGQGVLRGAVHPRRQAPGSSRQPSGLRRRPGARRPIRHPPHLRAPVDQGPAHGHVGERQAAAAAGVGHRLRRRSPAVHHPVRLRRVRPVPRAEGAGAGVGRRLDRVLARSHRCGLRPHLHRRAGAAEGEAQRLLPTPVLDQLRSGRAHRSRPSPSASASTGSCGRATSPTPTTRRTTSTTSTSWPRCSATPTAGASSATTSANCST